jgi:hypothetical protein
MNKENEMMNKENEMNKYGLEFMNKFELGDKLGDMSVEEFFDGERDFIDSVVNKSGWYYYENCRGVADIEYVGNELKNMEELRKSEKEFLGDWSDELNDFVVDDDEIKKDFIDIDEEVCYVYVRG